MARRKAVIVAVLVVVIVVAAFGLAYANHVAGLGCVTGSAPGTVHAGSVYAPSAQLVNGQLDITGGEPHAESYHVPVGTEVAIDLPATRWNGPTNSNPNTLIPEAAVRYCDGSSRWPFQAAAAGQSHLSASETGYESDRGIDVTIVVP
jgi:hypothetical protein